MIAVVTGVGVRVSGVSETGCRADSAGEAAVGSRRAGTQQPRAGQRVQHHGEDAEPEQQRAGAMGTERWRHGGRYGGVDQKW